jgi:hypothetical protein
MGLIAIKTYANKLLFKEGAVSAVDTPSWIGYFIKESMLYGTDDIKGGNASWSVVGSSNSSSFNMSGTDLWTDYTKVVRAAGNHSWIVLKQIALGASPGFLQVCIDFNSASAYAVTLVFSRAAGFTSGAINARPTATDEVVVATTGNITSASTTTSCGVNCLKSTDGKVTRIFHSVDGDMTSQRQYWFMEQLNNVESYWTSDFVVGACIPTVSGLVASSNIFTRQGTASHAGRMTSEGNYSLQLSNGAGPPGLQTPDRAGKWLAYPCGYLIDTGLNKGRLGAFFDLWAAPVSMGNFEYLAAAGGGDFKFVNINDYVFPWVGTALMVP